MSRGILRSTIPALLAVTAVALCSRRAAAEPGPVIASARMGDRARDGVYDRLDGDLDLDLGLGAELGSSAGVAPALRASAHYFSMAGVYLEGRVRARDQASRSLFGLGVDVRPLFVPRWAKGYETGPSFRDLTLDSCSLSLGVFWAAELPHATASQTGRGFEAGLGFGVPLFASAAGPWLEARGLLRYPDAGAREAAVLITFSWHAFVLTPLSAKPSSGL
ncbi:MAG: hypothetical protein ABJB12_07265 [Pseudomonadota bacterium]